MRGEDEEAEFLMVTDVAKLAGVSGDTVRYWDRTHKLRAVRTPGSVSVRLFPKESVLQFLAERAAQRRSLEAE